MRPVAGSFRSTLGNRRLLLLIDTVLVLCLAAFVGRTIAAHAGFPLGPRIGPVVLLGLTAAAFGLLTWGWLDFRRDADNVERMRENEARFRLLTAQVPADVWTTDTKLRFTSVYGSLSPSPERADLGGSGTTLYELFATRDESHPVIAAHRRALAGQSARYQRAEGPSDIEGRVEPLRDGTGAVVGCVGIALDVTKQRTSEQRLRLLGNAIECASDMISITDAENRFVYVNEAFLRTYGYLREEVLGRTPALLEASDDVRREIFSTTMQGGWSGDLVNRRKDGAEFPVSLSTTVIRDSEGDILGLLGVARDISERKRAGEVSSRYRALVESSHDAIIGVSMDGAIESWNASAEALYGYRAEEAIGRPLEILAPPDRFTELQSKLENAGQGRRIETYETERVRKDGVAIAVSVTASPVRDDVGRVVGTSGIHRDITERKRAEAALRHLAAIVESSDDAILSTDTAHVIRSWNAGAERLFGYAAVEAIGKDVEALLNAPAARAQVRRAREALDCGAALVRYEGTRERKDASLVGVAVAISAMRDASGALTGYSVVIHDITERRRTEERLRESEEHLRALAGHLESAREEERARMARGIHDELGQMLTALRLDLSWLANRLRGPTPGAKRKLGEMIAIADEAIEAGRRIVADLRPPILDDLGLVPAVQWFAEHLGKRAGLRIRLLTDGGEPELEPSLAIAGYRIVQEALTNIARHAHARNVEVWVGARGGNLVLEVRDDGCGIPASAESDPRSFGIAGMRERARMAGGTLEVSGTAGVGTLVRVAIPIERRPAAPDPA